MPIQTLEDIAATTGPLLGLDPGTKTLGLAISDRTRLIATPLKTIRRKKFTPDATELLEIYENNEAAALIIGPDEYERYRRSARAIRQRLRQ